MHERLKEIQKALESYMEEKRKNFPRFYFISNDDLLDILVHSDHPEHLQTYFKKCFDNINRVDIVSATEQSQNFHLTIL